MAGHAAYGYCASHSGYFWGFRLYLLCASDGMPLAFELAAANVPERDVATELLARVDLDGYTVIADKGFGGLGAIRQWIESVFDTLKGQLSLEHHGAITMPGLITRIAQRLLALAAGLRHNWQVGNPGRDLTTYDH